MNVLKPVRQPFVFSPLLLLAILSIPGTSRAQQDWKATVAGQSKDMGRQAIAFLPRAAAAAFPAVALPQTA